MKPISKKELQNMYGVSKNVLLCWLKKIPGDFYEKIKFSKLLTPEQLNIIFNHIGQP
jgi:hypothetical protein